MNFYKNYVKQAQDFAKTAKAWAWLDDSRWYTVRKLNDWEESCDNVNGGFSIAWAYKLSPQQINAYAGGELLREIMENLRTVADLLESADEKRETAPSVSADHLTDALAIVKYILDVTD